MVEKKWQVVLGGGGVPAFLQQAYDCALSMLRQTWNFVCMEM